MILTCAVPPNTAVFKSMEAEASASRPGCVRGTGPCEPPPNAEPKNVENTSPHIAESRAGEAASTGVRIVGVNAGIIHTALIRIGQHIVGVVHFLELVLELRSRDIRGDTYG